MRKSAKEILETIAGAGVTAEIILKGSPDEITLEAQSLVWALLDELETSRRGMRNLFNLFCKGFCAAALIGEPSPSLFAYVLGEVIA